MGFKYIDLGEVAEVMNGYAFKSVEFSEVGIPVIKIKNIVPPNISLEDVQYVSEEIYQKKSNYALNYGDILISMTGSGVNQIASAVGKVGRFNLKCKALLNQRVGKIYVSDKTKYDEDFLYYVLSQQDIRYTLASSAGGSANQANINPTQIKQLKIPLPALSTQKKISYILKSIDEKITNNTSIISTLEKISQELFRRWFSDYEFPNEQGLPYHSSGGEMVESELGDIPLQWEIGNFNDIYDNFDSKRKPLSKLEREKREKIYPYYGAATLMDYVDDYLFDDIYLLLGEDGTVTTKEGNPVLQYVWGKFWVNNHAHVIKGANGFSTEYIYNLMKNTVVTDIVTGAVQAKISQKNLNSIKVVIPPKEVLSNFESVLNKNYVLVRNLCDENQNLIKLRDTLLPKLLSGEIEIPDESVVES